jgi:hypothetical protein
MTLREFCADVRVIISILLAGIACFRWAEPARPFLIPAATLLFGWATPNSKAASRLSSRPPPP